MLLPSSILEGPTTMVKVSRRTMAKRCVGNRLAAEQGYADGQLNLGFMYGNGEGVPEDLVYAYMWYNLSAAQGNEIAQRNKEIFEQRMTREQIAEAQRLSREWIETHPQDGGN